MWAQLLHGSFIFAGGNALKPIALLILGGVVGFFQPLHLQLSSA